MSEDLELLHARILSMADERGPVKLLVIDDDEDCFLLIEHILRSASVKWAQTGKEGLALLARENFDAALVDEGMPGMPGHAVLHQIRLAYRTVFPVLITGGDISEIIARTGPVFAIKKPPQPGDLIIMFDTIDQWRE